jgi:hypothetical protein
VLRIAGVRASAAGRPVVLGAVAATPAPVPPSQLASPCRQLRLGVFRAASRAPPLVFASSPASSHLTPPQPRHRQQITASWAHACVLDRPIAIRRIGSVLTRVRAGQTRAAHTRMPPEPPDLDPTDQIRSPRVTRQAPVNPALTWQFCKESLVFL